MTLKNNRMSLDLDLNKKSLDLQNVTKVELLGLNKMKMSLRLQVQPTHQPEIFVKLLLA